MLHRLAVSSVMSASLLVVLVLFIRLQKVESTHREWHSSRVFYVQCYITSFQ